MLAPIVTRKHYVHFPATAKATGTAQTIPIAAAAVAPATTNSSDVTEGSVVKAVYVEMWGGAAAENQTMNACVVKNPSGVAAPTYAEMQNLGAYANKKNILQFHQGLAPANGVVIPLFREWIKIPKGKQRMGLADSIDLVVSATGTTISFCGDFTYKEYQ